MSNHDSTESWLLILLSKNLPEIEVLTGIPIIGPKTAVCLITEWEDIRRLWRLYSSNAINAYVDINLIHYESSEYTAGDHIRKRGNSYGRKVLYRAVLSIKHTLPLTLVCPITKKTIFRFQRNQEDCHFSCASTYTDDVSSSIKQWEMILPSHKKYDVLKVILVYFNFENSVSKILWFSPTSKYQKREPNNIRFSLD